jgi:hypothetical protein
MYLFLRKVYVGVSEVGHAKLNTPVTEFCLMSTLHVI